MIASMNRRLWPFALGGAAIALCALAGARGPLDPPSGPVAPTGKPLSEMEPRTAVNSTNTPGDSSCKFRIATSGSYYLTEDVVVAASDAGMSGICIEVQSVSVDLNGYRVRGEEPNLYGIWFRFDLASSHPGNLTIKNGVISGFGSSGIRAEFAYGSHYSGLHVYNTGTTSGSQGAIITGNGCAVEDCEVTSNGGGGIGSQDGCTIVRCTAHGNSGAGIRTGNGCTVSQCTSSNNGGAGGHGIWLQTSSGDGNGSTVTNCTFSFNGGSGVLADQGCTISGCTAFQNDAAGITVSNGCTVLGNTCMRNRGPNSDAAGILVPEFRSGSRIEGNNTRENIVGIRVLGSHNFVVRNSSGSGGETAFDIASENTFGELVHLATGGELTNANSSPWANFLY
jgi:parallel beta-helix repeat protein